MWHSNKSATMWKSHGDLIYHLEIDKDKPDSHILQSLFIESFMQRDHHYGKPEYERFEESGHSLKVNFGLRELAEAFFSVYTSKQMAQQMKMFLDHDTTDDFLVDTIEILDEFFIYGYILNEHRYRKGISAGNAVAGSNMPGTYEFWRIFSPSLKNEEWKKIIPKKYWSRSKFAEISPKEEDGVENHFSPLLKKSSKFDYLRHLLGHYAGVPVEDAFKLKKIHESGREISAMDEIRLRFLRKWCHPIVLIYDGANPAASPQFYPHGIWERMSCIKHSYPVFDGGAFGKGHVPPPPWESKLKDPLEDLIRKCEGHSGRGSQV